MITQLASLLCSMDFSKPDECRDIYALNVENLAIWSWVFKFMLICLFVRLNYVNFWVVSCWKCIASWAVLKMLLECLRICLKEIFLAGHQLWRCIAEKVIIEGP